MSQQLLPARQVTKTVTIARPADEVHAFLADPANWPTWAIVNVLDIEPDPEPGWWVMDTPRGQARLRVRGDVSTGLLDHDYVEHDALWTVPARVVPNGSGSTFLITFFQPPAFDDDFFDDQISLIDKELAELKRVLET